MPIPDFQSSMRPLLVEVQDGMSYRLGDVVDKLADVFQLSEEERRALLPSGRAKLFYNRVAWAKTHLAHAGLLVSPERGAFKITEAGLQVLRTGPERLDMKYLARFEGFRAFRVRTRQSADAPGKAEALTQSEVEETPEEAMERAWNLLRRQTEQELLERILAAPPAFFEQMVVDLLVAMGYGGSRADAGEKVGRTGDGGIDGIIKEDKLGLDMVYVQAKRWEGTVGRPDVQRFAGSLEGFRARKGVFITTSTFTGEAKQYVEHIEKRIVLVDGPMLAQLLLDHCVGVTNIRTYTVSRVDLDYFETP